MISPADSVCRTAALGGSSSSHMEETGNRSLLKWKLQVKIMTTRITVIRRFERKYSAKSFQCGIAPGLTTASPQSLSKVKKSNTSEGSKTRNLSTGSLFSPNSPIQDAPKQRFNSEKKNGEGFSFKKGDVFKDHLALSPIQILLTLLSFQMLKEADLPDEALGGLIIVTVIALESRQEGTTATYNPIVRTVLKVLLLLICLSNFEKSGVNAQDDSEDGKLECPIERVDLPYNVQAAAWTFVAGIFMIAFIAGRINRRPSVPATAAAPLALPLAAAPLALPLAAAPLAVLPAAAPLALPLAAAPLAVLPAAAPLALPLAAAPLALPLAAAPLALPLAAAPPAVLPAAAPLALPLAAAPLAVLPAVAPLAVPAPAIPIGFVNVMDALNENPDPARKRDPVFYISPQID